MAKTDWRFTDTVIPEDLNGIGEEINGLRTEISTRFDHEATTPLTLQPGLQVVHAEKDSRFKLGEIRGRTLVNLLGQMGSVDSLDGWLYDLNAAVLDSTDKIEGTASVKGIISNGQHSDIFYSFPYESSKRYVALGELKTYGGATARIRMVESEGLVELSSPLFSSEAFETAFFKVPANLITSGHSVYFGTVFAGSNGSGGHVDALRIYEISEAEYEALDGMTPEQVALKYPFVPSGIVGVENPYVINTSGNLLPPFYDSWYTSPNATISIISAYEILLQTTGGAQGFVHFPSYPVFKNTTYTFSAEHNAGLNVHAPGIGAIASNVREGSVTFNTGEATSINIAFVDGGAGGGVAGTYSIKNPTLTIGPDSQPFTPQRKSMLAFDTELHANPTDGTEPDILFEQNGQYKKLAKWKKLTLDTTPDWLIAQNNPGFKVFALPLPSAIASSQFLIKFDGSQVANTTPGVWTSGDQVLIADNSHLYLSISNTDSGWGDDYTPTQDEIKAYFMGWYMGDPSNSWGPYNGVGAPGWIPRDKAGNLVQGVAVGSVPNTTLSTYGFTPYNLLYRLAKETVEPVVTDGSLLLSEGDNIVEVGTGIVLRERANPVKHGTTIVYYFINRTSVPESLLKNKTREILCVYSDNKDQTKLWTMVSDDTANGLVRATFGNVTQDFDPSAAYSVTYTKLDKSPIQPITGVLAANEKAQISDLTAGVTEALQRVSVVEQKKAEKDVPGWIKPTLLNGWVNIGSGSSTAGYYKDALGHIHIRGIVTSGVSNSFVFKLPAGYRPKESRNFTGVYYGPSSGVMSCLVAVGVEGTVIVVFDYPPNWISLDGISFLAEQ